MWDTPSEECVPGTLDEPACFRGNNPQDAIYMVTSLEAGVTQGYQCYRCYIVFSDEGDQRTIVSWLQLNSVITVFE